MGKFGPVCRESTVNTFILHNCKRVVPALDCMPYAICDIPNSIRVYCVALHSVVFYVLFVLLDCMQFCLFMTSVARFPGTVDMPSVVSHYVLCILSASHPFKARVGKR